MRDYFTEICTTEFCSFHRQLRVTVSNHSDYNDLDNKTSHTMEVEGYIFGLASFPGSGVARVPRSPGQMVGMATCYYKVNFDFSFENLGFMLLLKLTKLKS